MHIRCSVGNCDPCRKYVHITYNGTPFFCFSAFNQAFRKDHYINMEMPTGRDEEEVVVSQETGDIVGECCGEVA